jgi:hypothetical protein
LDRVLNHEVKAQLDELRKMREKMLASTSSIFDQVRKSSSALGSTLSDFNQLTKRAATVEVRAPSIDHFHAMNEQFARQARERAEELEMVRLTGKMTAESAKTLKDLADAATVFRDRRVIRIAEVPIADGPVAGRANVGMCAAGIGSRHTVEALEALGQVDGRFGHRDHGRTRSNTRPRNQKFSTPAHSA